ncbi:MAG: T9SS type A sorting domain-containing protein [Saprospiraceae bacterium]
MKRLLPCLLALFSCSILSAQFCTPDPAYMDSTGVFPMPYHPTVNPSGGINECAYVGEPYEFVFTIGVGDTLTYQGAKFGLVKVRVDNVLNLPSGLAYACEPGGCEFLKNTIGCAKIYGTSNAAPGDYQLEIKATVFTSGFPPVIPNITFPNADIAPGEYKLQLLPDHNTACTAVATREILSDKMKIETSPNPASGQLNIDISAEIAGEFNFKVLDLTGKTAHQEKVAIFKGSNRISLDGSRLPNGIYLAFLESVAGIISKKFTIQH